MKIVFLSHFDLNLYLFRLPIMQELVKRGHKVYAVCPRGDVFNKFKNYGIDAVEYEIDRASLNIFKEIKTIRNIKKVIEKIQPDILHTFMHKPNIYGNLTDYKNRINTITGLGSFFIHNNFKSRMIRKIIEMGYKVTTKNTKKVVFQNSDDLNYFIKNNLISKEKAVLIKSSGIDTKKWKNELTKEELNTIKQKLKIHDDKPIVLMIARVIKDKGVNEFIQSANLLKEKAHFLYVGDFDKGNRNSFSPKWGAVKYLGFRKDIKELISICDIFVLPSYYGEGVPRTLLEASSMSKAIITTNHTGCREVVNDNENGFLVPIKDYKSLAEKIETLIENRDLREKFGKNSRKKVEREFDIKIVVKKYLEVYEEILSV